jgi:hypothetical protein
MASYGYEKLNVGLMMSGLGDVRLKAPNSNIQAPEKLQKPWVNRHWMLKNADPGIRQE